MLIGEAGAWRQVEPRLVRRVMYDRAVDFWNILTEVLMEMHPEKMCGNFRGIFWAAHQRFFRQMLIAAKVRSSCQAWLPSVAAPAVVLQVLHATS
jgi:hypothetical protein